MKTLLIILTTILLVSCGSSKFDAEAKMNSFKVIDLPEEINLVSVNPKEPDLLVGYNLNDTLHIGYSITTRKLRDYQLDIIDDTCYIYDGNRLVGKCPMKDNMIEQLIDIDNQ